VVNVVMSLARSNIRAGSVSLSARPRLLALTLDD
jgi:hypothetical protein